ncbi:MAG: xanthine dehydrogenase family protein molybdopterin-binding subunit [Spirochaetales bacterium]|nr:xanthine dehydrogenase family protein molybdopterin-binding subunit [Spirochaetales bacterium]
MSSTISRSVERVDARSKSRGEADYIADRRFDGALSSVFLRSPVPRGTIRRIAVPELDPGYTFVTARDIPEGGKNAVPMITSDWRVFAEETVRYLGEQIGLLVGPDPTRLEELLDSFSLDIEEATPAFTDLDALACLGGPIHGEDNLFSDHTIVKGDPDAAFDRARRVFESEFQTGYQEHVYMEPQGVVATVEEGRPTIYISTQCPFYVRKGVSGALGCSPDEVTVKQCVTGGGFGGKEHFPDVLAAAVTVAALAAGSPVRFIMERGEDLLYSTKRHPSRTRYRVAVDENDRVVALDVDLMINAGAYQSGSGVVLQRAMFSAAGVYDIPNVRIRGRALCTNTVPNDAFRGFGAPQALFAAETLMTHIARDLGVDEVEFRRRMLLKEGSVTVTNGRIREVVRLPEMLEHVMAESDYRRKDREFGRGNRRGIGISLFKHGSAFTGSGERDIIKSRVTIKKRADGRPEIKASIVEIGQGALTTLRKIVAEVLEIPVSQVLYHESDTSKVPDSGPTCASRSVGIVGYLLQEAAKKLKGRLDEPGEFEVHQDYRHPEGLEWDAETFQGDAYPSYSWGVNAVEVEVDRYTYEVTVRGVWTAYDVGRAIDEKVVRGQIEGGASQGLGYAGLEKLELADGRYRQATMADYMIPTSLDFPPIASELFDNPYEHGPFGAKGAGEVVFDGLAPAYAAAVQKALDLPVHRIPVTPEYIMELIHEKRDTVSGKWTRSVGHGQPAQAAP